jgi:Cytochrome c3/Doubled CXXCH motif (Paired_CXXCH_1)
MPVLKLMTNKKLLIFCLAVMLLLGFVLAAGGAGASPLAERGADLRLVRGWMVLPAQAAANDQSGALTNANCIMCHQDHDLNGYTRDSLRVSLTVDETAYNQSVHGQAGVLCVGCHSTFTTYPHSDVEQVTCEQCHVENMTIVVPLQYDNGRAMEAHFNETCRNCHADIYSANSIHSAVAAAGQVNAPLCTDCHGSHEVQSPAVPPSRILTTCGRCHTTVYQDFLAGKHNAADPLTQTCADCHIPHEGHVTSGEVLTTPEPTPVAVSGDQSYLVQWNSSCTMCHAYPNFIGKAEDSSTISLTVLEKELSQSVHGQAGLGCAACHPSITGYPHSDVEQVACSTCHASAEPNAEIVANLPYPTTRSLSTQLNEACRTCHEDQFTATTKGMHAQSLADGNPQAPLCIDCHGSHGVQPATSRASIPETCAKCHTAAYTSYQSSVHGTAVAAGNLDAPTCADCHGMHTVSGPSEIGFRNASVAICTLPCRPGNDGQIRDCLQYF